MVQVQYHVFSIGNNYVQSFYEQEENDYTLTLNFYKGFNLLGNPS